MDNTLKNSSDPWSSPKDACANVAPPRINRLQCIPAAIAAYLNNAVNASGYIFADSTVKLLERFPVIRRGL